jgi:hypothetical protein
MCVTFCHRTSVLYWNHDDCAGHCRLARGPHGRCRTCTHREEAVCRLTRAPLPEAGGCCHHNVPAAWRWQVVTRAMLEPLGVTRGETPGQVLARWDAPYRALDRLGRVVLVDPGQLGVPEVAYGIGTVGEDEFPWPEVSLKNKEVH